MMAMTQQIFDRVPDAVTARVQMVRGLVSGGWSQLQKIRLLLEFRHEHQQLREALTFYRYTLALMVAYRAGLLDALGDRLRSTEALATECGMTPHAAELLLRILETQAFVVRDESLNGHGTRWRRTDFARHYIARDGALSYAPLIELLASFGQSLDAIVDGLRTGAVPSELDVFRDDARVDAFLAAVNAYLDGAGRELLATVDLPTVETFICGSMGVSFSALLLHRFPEAKVTYGCLEHLVERIPRLREQYGVDPACVEEMHTHGGEPASDRWGSESFDLVFLTRKMVLAPEAQLGLRFARKAREVLNPGGVTIFWEAVHHDGPTTPMPLAMESILDLAISPSGCVLTRGRVERQLLDIGYREIEFVPCLGGETSFVVARA